MQWLAESLKGMFEKLGQTKPAAANRFLQVVKNMFQFAAEHGKWSKDSPVNGTYANVALLLSDS